jgi:hypothetical protein
MEIVIGQQYQHYKGNIYTVLSVGKHADTHEDYVVYQGQYTDAVFGKNPIWTRPLKDFKESVVVEGKSMYRFTPLSEASL